MEICTEQKDIPELNPIEERSKIVLINTINQAKERLGVRQGLEELADSATYAWAGNRLSLASIETPIPITAERFLKKTIEDVWKLTKVFKYCLSYRGETTNEICHFYYFEAIFSQPTAAYPIPQATASLYFRVEEVSYDKKKAPMMYFRVEGYSTDHDVRYVAPTADWLLALIQQKMKFFQRVEALRLF